MTGNRNDAARALAGEGQIIGQGFSRDAFLIDGVVYKVENDLDLIDDANIDEWNNYVKFQSWNLEPSVIRIPAMSRYDFGEDIVLAVEYIDGMPVGECYCTQDDECDESCISADIQAICQNDYEVYDLGYGNIIQKGDLYYLVDFAC